MGLSGYGKIYNLGHYALENLLLDSVVVEEKIDGSQFSFAKINGELFCASRGQQLHIEGPEKLFIEAVDSAKQIFDKLQDGWIYRTEYLKKPKHNTLNYDRVPEAHLIIFDIARSEEAYLSYQEKNQN